MYFRFFPAESGYHLHLFRHVCGDFGTAGMPGTFKRFFDVVVGMARSVHVLTLPMAVYVDDCALIGAIAPHQSDPFNATCTQPRRTRPPPTNDVAGRHYSCAAETRHLRHARDETVSCVESAAVGNAHAGGCGVQT